MEEEKECGERDSKELEAEAAIYNETYLFSSSSVSFSQGDTDCDCDLRLRAGRGRREDDRGSVCVCVVVRDSGAQPSDQDQLASSPRHVGIYLGLFFLTTTWAF
jgi:hypothetical protein